MILTNDLADSRSRSFGASWASDRVTSVRVSEYCWKGVLDERCQSTCMTNVDSEYRPIPSPAEANLVVHTNLARGHGTRGSGSPTSQQEGHIHV
jgi:hypothetical protein